MAKVVTAHIQKLILNGLELAQAVDGADSDVAIGVGQTYAEPDDNDTGYRMAFPQEILEAAADDLIHAAAELRMEAKACRGWKQR